MSDMESYERNALREDARLDAESDFREAVEAERTTIREQLEYAPRAQPRTSTVVGWTTPLGNYLCVECAGRILARGCSLPRGSVALWEPATASSSCCGHSTGETMLRVIEVHEGPLYVKAEWNDSSLDAMQQFVGGYIEIVLNIDGADGRIISMFGDEEAKLKSSAPMFVRCDGDIICGPKLFISAADARGEPSSLTDDDVKRIANTLPTLVRPFVQGLDDVASYLRVTPEER